MTKSYTQMTKKELLEVIKDKDRTIAFLNEKLDQVELAAIASEAKPFDPEESRMIESLIARIKELEAGNE